MLTVTINRPEVLNAVDGLMHTELSTVFIDAAADPMTDIVVLTGAGTAFCAGGDIGWMQQMVGDPSSFERTGAEAKRIIFSLLDLEKPIICRMNGDAIGLGATLALFCDVVLAVDTARIADPHVRVGLVAGDGGAVIWPQLIGYVRAKEYLMTGDMIPANDAARIGLINYALSADALDDAVDALAGRLRDGATNAIRWSKTAINIGLKQLAHSIMDASIAYETVSSRSPDHIEAVDAFLSRRRPIFGKRRP